MRSFLLLCLTALLSTAVWSQDFYSLDSIHDIRVTLSYERWEELLDSMKQSDGGRLTSDVRVDGVLYEGAGIRYKGNSSYHAVRRAEEDKLPFNIKIDHEIEEQRLPGGYGTLKLSNVFRDPSFLREALAYEIAGHYLPSPRANYVHLHINDQYMGLYNSSESVDEKFLETNFGDNDGVLVKCDPIWNLEPAEGCPEGDNASLMYLGQDSLCYRHLYEMKSDHGWAELIELTRVLAEEPERIEEYLDVDQTLWMLAFDNVLVNLDSYIGRLCHNYYLYQDSLGYFHPIVWDMNMAFGGFVYTGLDEVLSVEEMQTMSPLLHLKERNEKRPLITKLLSNPLYRKVYLAHVRTILEEQLISGRYIERGKEIQQSIDTLVQRDTNRLYPYKAFKFNFEHDAEVDGVLIPGIINLMSKRTEYLQAHPLIKAEPPVIQEVEHAANAEEYVVTARVQGADQVWLCYREGAVGVFHRIQMLDDGVDSDGLAEDGVWSAAMSKKTGVQYYVVAENKAAARLAPRRASRASFRIPDDLKAAE